MPNPSSPRVHMKSLNCRKSEYIMHNFLNDPSTQNFDFLLLQELPYSIATRSFWKPDKWIPIFPSPSPQASRNSPIRSLILVSHRINSNSYSPFTIPSLDVVGLKLQTRQHTIFLFSVYNDCEHNYTIQLLDTILSTLLPPSLYILLGDFNRHDVVWAGPLHPERTNRDSNWLLAAPLIHLMGTYHVQQVLPQGTPTHYSESAKTWSTIDLAFLSDDLSSNVTRCAASDMYGSDHKSIELVLDLDLTRNEFVPRPLYRSTDWEAYAKDLAVRLGGAARMLNSRESIDVAVSELTNHIQDALKKHTPMSKPSPYAKRWWSPELSDLRKEHKRASRKASARGASVAEREDARAKQRSYFSAIRRQKRRHWREWLEQADMHSVWMANKVVSAPTNVMASRTPPLKTPTGGVAETAEEKCEVLLETFFPTPP
ncbi:Endonuclease/exonuclease/phosphatase, partial [Favolaschia claudopus]